MQLPDQIAIFPLPNVVLFPQVDLPLHIFEPRYREMVADAMAGERLIGMVLARPAADGSAPPAIYPTGCVGRIEEIETLPDGRANLILRGERRFNVEQEVDGKDYRRARVQWAASERILPDARDESRLQNCVADLLRRAEQPGADEVWERLPEDWEEKLNILCFGLPLDEVERMALLESPDSQRLTRLIEVLEFRLAEHDTLSPGAGPLH